ncbi:MAG: PHP domain-containing protein [Acidobacteriaceae bacterium]
MIDLHCHTTCSDGTLSPTALVTHAASAGVRLLAITDHDTVQAWDMAIEPARAAGIELLCGVELSTHLSGASRSVHLLGYFPSRPDPAFVAWLNELQESRRTRNAALLARLQQLGLDIQWSEVAALAQQQVGRPHFATVLVRKGYVKDLSEAFEVYLSEGGKAWVGREEPTLAEALQRLRTAGALSSLAHPVRISRDWERLNQLIAEYAGRGLDAIECYHSEHCAEDVAQLSALARRHGLALTGGSDFHGDTKPGVNVAIGLTKSPLVPAYVADHLRTRLGLARSSDRNVDRLPSHATSTTPGRAAR